MSEWIAEVRVAAEWWRERLVEALYRAFPADTLFVSLAPALSSVENMDKFVSELATSIDGDFRRRKVPWNRAVPLEGARVRRIGIEGAFRSDPIVMAASACGLDEVLPFLKQGCTTTISPGVVYTVTDKTDRGKAIEVAPPEIPGHLKGVWGDGI